MSSLKSDEHDVEFDLNVTENETKDVNVNVTENVELTPEDLESVTILVTGSKRQLTEIMEKYNGLTFKNLNENVESKPTPNPSNKRLYLNILSNAITELSVDVPEDFEQARKFMTLKCKNEFEPLGILYLLQLISGFEELCGGSHNETADHMKNTLVDKLTNIIVDNTMKITHPHASSSMDLSANQPNDNLQPKQKRMKTQVTTYAGAVVNDWADTSYDVPRSKTNERKIRKDMLLFKTRGMAHQPSGKTIKTSKNYFLSFLSEYKYDTFLQGNDEVIINNILCHVPYNWLVFNEIINGVHRTAFMLPNDMFCFVLLRTGEYAGMLTKPNIRGTMPCWGDNYVKIKDIKAYYEANGDIDMRTVETYSEETICKLELSAE